MAARSRAESWPGGAPDGLGCPAPMHGVQRAMLQFAGATVDGEASTV